MLPQGYSYIYVEVLGNGRAMSCHLSMACTHAHQTTHTRTHTCAHTHTHDTHTYTQVLAIITIGAGASSQSSVDVFQDNHPLPRNTDAAGGWLIFISFWVMLYQVIVILQRFLNFGIINNNIALFLILVSTEIATPGLFSETS